MDQADIQGFFIDPQHLRSEDHVVACYRVLIAGEAPRVAAALCAEQSTAMWQRVGVAEDLRPRYAAKVLRLAPSVSSQTVGDAVWWDLEIAYPHHNIGPRLPNLLVALAGEGALHAPGVQGLILRDIKFPATYAAQFTGPQWGVAGLRERFGVIERPFFMGVIKPNFGLAPEVFAAQAYEAWGGGLDIAKDDEMLGDVAWSPLTERVAAVVAARRRAEAETGERKAYIANVTDDSDRIASFADVVAERGGDAVLLNPMWTGIGAIAALRRSGQLPIMSHFAGLALLTRAAQWRIEMPVLVKFLRLAGADMIGLAGFGPRMHTTADEVRAGVAACLAPWPGIRPALPIPGGGDWAGTLPTVYAQIGHPDFAFIAGRGVFGHPRGPRAGARSVCQAWDAVRAGVPLSDAAAAAPELAAALQFFGGVP
ncbi:MAG: ribulose 1,5-bisphosphate carboxylase [Deltaproteobacteria bacterium]|nr:ribulose 1,5-bisphosphate carboxylase [Deltaproteobacteria bacterium]